MDRWVRRCSLALVVSVVAAGAANPAQAATMTYTQLDALRDRLVREAPVDSMAWVDRKANRVVLRLTAPAPAAVSAMLADHLAKVDVKQTSPAKNLENLYSGHGMQGQRQTVHYCTTGPMTSIGSTTYILTAGHCVSTSAHWERKGNYLGQRTDDWVYGPDGDFGRITEKGVTFTPQYAVNTNLSIGYPKPGIIQLALGVATAEVGQTLCKMGNTTKYTCGVVTAIDASQNKPGFVMEGLIRAEICSEPGDSGGPLMTPVQVGPTVYAWPVGITLNGNGDCNEAEIYTNFEPLQKILDWYGLELGPARS
ncbi:hypothetical protein Rhe02_35590 [Rhizocola hellebori]|uniref:Peptidase S1 domain-containing protein n=1 Tax=Rhizocola hellebori TaxID=1392758 RepID=A0A8J3Q8W6_9ACTN|nr:S1 family peptidase [Rhizocola hellebori]GIH05492.1 hypothetical protein Rhe02_35590 [Rhizocola hellebori]